MLELARHDAGDVAGSGFCLERALSPNTLRSPRTRRSPVSPGPYTLDDLGHDVLALRDSIGAERFSFCGLIVGGMVGMWLASEAPERVERLVLCCTSALLGPRELWDERIRVATGQG